VRLYPPANPYANPLLGKEYVIPDVYYKPLRFGLDFKLTNYTNVLQNLGYATYFPLSEIRKIIYNPYAYPR
jgi:hypothetical protein